MLHLLNLLAAIALLVWGTHIVRTGMMRLLGENLGQVLERSFSHRLSAVGAGIAVTGLVQSSTATCLMLASFAVDTTLWLRLTILIYAVAFVEQIAMVGLYGAVSPDTRTILALRGVRPHGPP